MVCTTSQTSQQVHRLVMSFARAHTQYVKLDGTSHKRLPDNRTDSYVSHGEAIHCTENNRPLVLRTLKECSAC